MEQFLNDLFRDVGPLLIVLAVVIVIGLIWKVSEWIE